MPDLCWNLSILEDCLSNLISNISEVEGGGYLLRAVFQDGSNFEVNRFGLGYEQEVTSVYLWNIKIHYRCWPLGCKEICEQKSQKTLKIASHMVIISDRRYIDYSLQLKGRDLQLVGINNKGLFFGMP